MKNLPEELFYGAGHKDFPTLLAMLNNCKMEEEELHEIVDGCGTDVGICSHSDNTKPYYNLNELRDRYFGYPEFDYVVDYLLANRPNGEFVGRHKDIYFTTSEAMLDRLAVYIVKHKYPFVK